MSKATAEIMPLTGVRGAAAIVVMVYHFHHHMLSTGPISTALSHGYLSVDLFFILSGFVMAHMYGDAVRRGSFRLREFLGHRFARIYPLYCLLTLGFIALSLVKSHGAGLSAPLILSNLLMLQALGNWESLDPPAWSVSVEAIAYLLFPVIALLCLCSGRRLAALVGAVALGAILLLTIASSRHIIGSSISMGELDLFYSPYTIVRCLAGFTLGQLVWRYHGTWIGTAGVRDSVQIAMVTIMLVLLTHAGTDFPIYVLIIGLILILSTSRGILPRIFSSPPFLLAGRLSLGIYLVHYKALGLLQFLRSSFGRISNAPVANDVVATLLSGLVVIGVSWLLHVVIERPGRLAIRRLQDQGRSKGPAPSAARPAREERIRQAQPEPTVAEERTTADAIEVPSR